MKDKDTELGLQRL